MGTTLKSLLNQVYSNDTAAVLHDVSWPDWPCPHQSRRLRGRVLMRCSLPTLMRSMRDDGAIAGLAAISQTELPEIKQVHLLPFFRTHPMTDSLYPTT